MQRDSSQFQKGITSLSGQNIYLSKCITLKKIKRSSIELTFYSNSKFLSLSLFSRAGLRQQGNLELELKVIPFELLYSTVIERKQYFCPYTILYGGQRVPIGKNRHCGIDSKDVSNEILHFAMLSPSYYKISGSLFLPSNI